MGAGLRPRVFISYKIEDPAFGKDRVRVLADLLEQRDIEVCWDEKVAWGAPWRRQLHTWLRECHAGIVVLTPASVGSDWVVAELNHLAIWAHTQDHFQLMPLLVRLTHDELGEVAALAPADLSHFQGRILSATTAEALADEAAERLAPLKDLLAVGPRAEHAGTLRSLLDLTADEALGAWYGRLGCVMPPRSTPTQLTRDTLDRCVAAGSDDEAWRGVLAVLGLFAARAGDSARRERVGRLLWPYTWVDPTAAQAVARLEQPQPEVRRVVLWTRLGAAALEAYARRAGADGITADVDGVTHTAPDASPALGDLAAELYLRAAQIAYPAKAPEERARVVTALVSARIPAETRAACLRRMDAKLQEADHGVRVPRVGAFAVACPDASARQEIVAALQAVGAHLPHARLCLLVDGPAAADEPMPEGVVQVLPVAPAGLEERAAVRFADLYDALGLETRLPAEVRALLPDEHDDFDELLAHLDALEG